MSESPTRRARAAAAITLVALAPAVGEILSGSTPLVVFLLAPGIAAFEVALYGFGALIVRELVVSWKRGWTSVLVLGAAYGLIEEGVVLKAVFDPGWPGAAALGSYGRLGGVGWVWLVQVDLFHAVVSIALPILLVELIFPQLRGHSWLGRRRRITLVTVWSLAVVAAMVLVRPEYAVEPQYFILLAAIVGLIALARIVPVPRIGSTRRPARRIAMFVVGAAATGSLFAVSWSGPESGRSPLVTIALQLGIAGTAAWWLNRSTRSGPLTGGEGLALAAGVLSLFVALALPRLSDGGSIVGAATLAGLLVLAKRTLGNDRDGRMSV